MKHLLNGVVVASDAMNFTPKLAQEAIFVGATLFPVYLVMNNLFEEPFLKVFATGATYHLLSEWSGLNAYYLENSHAADMRYGDLVSWHFKERDKGFDFNRKY